MLRKLTMENYLSFQEKTSIELASTNYKLLESSNVEDGIVKGLLFVGPNASGKTNALLAIKLLLDLLFAERNLSLGLSRCIFSKKKSFNLEYEFQILNHKIVYFIEYHTNDKNFIEKLIVDDRVAIDRMGPTGKSTLTDNDYYTDIDNNSLLLREIYFNTKFRNHLVLKLWFDFLMNSVCVDGHDEHIFSSGKVELEIEQYLEKFGAKEINSFFDEFNFDQRIEYATSSRGKTVYIENSLDEKDIYFKREGIGEPIPFPMESLGNQRLLRILPAFFHVVHNGGMLIIDEFSSGFHNFLEELLVKYFMKRSTAAQLFLVSHSTNLLSNSLLRPDQIYAVDFEAGKGSVIKRFSSEQPRAAQNLEKMYTSGVFGGVPNYGHESSSY